MIKKVMLIILIIVLCSWSVSYSPQRTEKQEKEAQEKGVRPPSHIKLRPDLLITNMWISTEKGSEGQTLIKINYIVKNDSLAHSSCCPTEEGEKEWKEHPHQNLCYEISVEARTYPEGRFRRLPNGGTVGTMTGPNEIQTYHAVDIYHSGKTKQYRVRLDPDNWIFEKKEDNNEKMIVWPLFK
jgi:hypothetical protein